MVTAWVFVAALCALLQLGAAAPKDSKASSASSSMSAQASAVPSYCPSGYRQTIYNINATFDNITTTPAASPPVPVPYYYLYYQSFVTRSVTINPPVSGPIPNTGNNYAVTSVRTQVTSGMPLLSVNYPVSTTVAFQLLSFFFACSTNTLNSEILSPTPCTLAITGYKGSDNTVASNQMVAAQTIRYIPSAMTGPVQMAKFVVLPAFNGATFVTFQYTNDLNTALTPTTAMAIDTVKYTVYNCN